MSNRLGINEYKLRELERQIVNQKLNLIDETFTFNRDEFNLDYLVSLNEFLFRDFYLDDELGLRKLDQVETLVIEKYLALISKICKSDPDNINEILDLMREIWHLQPFIVGNTRTLLAFLKVLNESFLLDLDIDVNSEIRSNPDTFKLNGVVNQKRLTRKK